MASLGDNLVHLSLEIDDKAKSAELLRQLIEDQNTRYESQVESFENEQNAVLQKITAERNEIQAKVSHTAERWIQKKEALESRVNELSTKKEEAEYSKKKNLDAIRRDSTVAKEHAYKAYKQEKSQREKAWFDGRVTEIHNLTWKGIQPNVERLTRKHKQQCHEIKSKTQFSKQKLELQCENDLLERVQVFQRNEQESNTCINRRSNFAQMLLKEQNDRAMNLMKLKEKFAQEEESAKELYSLQLKTLAKDHDIALSKIRRSKRIRQLTQELLARKDARQQELESRLERIGKDMNSSRAKWEQSWVQTSALRIEEKNKQKMNDLLAWRKKEVDGLIRQSILDEANSQSTVDDDGQLATECKEKVTELNDKLSKLKDCNRKTRSNISRIATEKVHVSRNMREIEESLKDIEGRRSKTAQKMDEKRRQQKEIIAEVSDCVERRFRSISLRSEVIEKEIESVNDKCSNELNNHHDHRAKVIQDHETKLEALQSRATKSAHEIDDKLETVQRLIQEQNSYLSQAQSLLNTRYKVSM